MARCWGLGVLCYAVVGLAGFKRFLRRDIVKHLWQWCSRGKTIKRKESLCRFVIRLSPQAHALFPTYSLPLSWIYLTRHRLALYPLTRSLNSNRANDTAVGSSSFTPSYRCPSTEGTKRVLLRVKDQGGQVDDCDLRVRVMERASLGLGRGRDWVEFGLGS